MSNKLQELTDKLLQDGVNKGNEEAEKIVTEAKSKAQQIINDAEAKAKEIIEEAEKKSVELAENTNSEIKLASTQSLAALKQQITDIVNSSVVNATVSETLKESDTVKSILNTLFENWSKNNSLDFNVLLPEKNKADLEALAKSSAKKLIEKGVELKTTAGISTGFQIVPKDGSYKLSFTDKDFQNFFSQFIRPKLAEFLFVEA
jgi:V/A-type H+-transporting ATPase subunit E